MKKTQIKLLKNEIQHIYRDFKISLNDMNDDGKLKSLQKFRDTLKKTNNEIKHEIFNKNKFIYTKLI